MAYKVVINPFTGELQLVNAPADSTVGLHWKNGTKFVNNVIQAITSAESGNCYLGTSIYGEVYKSTDYGATWTSNFNVFTLASGAWVQIDSMEYCGNGVIIGTDTSISGGERLFRTGDYGTTWTDLGLPTGVSGLWISTSGYPQNNKLVSCESGVVINAFTLQSGGLYSGSTPTVWRSVDYGSTWENQHTPSVVYFLSGDATFTCAEYCGNGIVLVGVGGGSGKPGKARVIKSTTYGTSGSWVSVGTAISGASIINVIKYLGNGVVLAGASNLSATVICAISKSEDFGDTWSTRGTLVSGQTSVVGMANLENGTVVVGTTPNSRIIRSIDYGETWQDLGFRSIGDSITELNYAGNKVCLGSTAAGGGASGTGYILRSTS